MSTETAERHEQPLTEDVESPLARLSEEQIEALGREFDAIHDASSTTSASATAATSSR